MGWDGVCVGMYGSIEELGGWGVGNGEGLLLFFFSYLCTQVCVNEFFFMDDGVRTLPA